MHASAHQGAPPPSPQGEMRISISFNVVARDKGGKGAVPGATDWELLADSSFLADGSG